MFKFYNNPNIYLLGQDKLCSKYILKGILDQYFMTGDSEVYDLVKDTFHKLAKRIFDFENYSEEYKLIVSFKDMIVDFHQNYKENIKDYRYYSRADTFDSIFTFLCVINNNADYLKNNEIEFFDNPAMFDLIYIIDNEATKYLRDYSMDLCFIDQLHLNKVDYKLIKEGKVIEKYLKKNKCIEKFNDLVRLSIKNNDLEMFNLLLANKGKSNMDIFINQALLNAADTRPLNILRTLLGEDEVGNLATRYIQQNIIDMDDDPDDEELTESIHSTIDEITIVYQDKLIRNYIMMAYAAIGEGIADVLEDELLNHLCGKYDVSNIDIFPGIQISEMLPVNKSRIVYMKDEQKMVCKSTLSDTTEFDTIEELMANVDDSNIDVLDVEVIKEFLENLTL